MISNEAVESGARVLIEDGKFGIPWEDASEDDRAEVAARVRAILEASARNMAAGALLNASDALEIQPPMLRAQYVDALRLYAAEPWRLTTCPSECAATNHPGAEHGATK